MLILFPQSPLYLLVVGRKAYLCGPASTPHWEMSGLCLLSSFPSPCLSDTHARCTKRGKMAIEQELLIGKTGKWWQKRQGQMHFSVTRSNCFFFFLLYRFNLSQWSRSTYPDRLHKLQTKHLANCLLCTPFNFASLLQINTFFLYSILISVARNEMSICHLWL